MKHFKKLLKNDIYSRKGNGFVASLFGATGFIGFYILHLLKNKPLYGEEIRKAIYNATGKTWKPNLGFIYPILKEMRKDWLIEGKWGLENVHQGTYTKLQERG